MTKLLIDSDVGVDDSFAILFALKCPELEVVGITSNFGNTTAQQAAENAMKLLDLAGADENIPVVEGATKPLYGEAEEPVTHIHGRNGLGNVELPPTKRKPLEISPEDFIYNTAKENNGKLAIVTLGRLTNIAKTLRKYPDFKDYVKQLVIMGGTIYAPGNIAPNAEANIYCDADAADEVFLSGIPIKLVGLDVTMKTRFTVEHIEHLKEFYKQDCKEIVDYLDKAFKFYRNFNRIQDNAFRDCPLHDPSAMLALVYPELYTTRYMKARVERSGEFSKGRIVVDRRESGNLEANKIEICLDVEDKIAVSRLIRVFCDCQYEY